MTLQRDGDLWLPTPTGADEYLGPYRLIDKVGSGGMGVVYLGVDPTDRPVAVKVLREHIAEDESARARLRRELDTLRRVRHRCVATVVDADLEHTRPYIVTEFISGPQLDAYIDRVGPLSRAGLANLGRGLFDALQAIHNVGIVHRDLKPGNILLHDDRPVVIDFGIAQLADDVRLTMTGLFVGTPGYVAPEVIDGARAGSATDWWGWAATLVFAASGHPAAGRGPVEVVLDRIRRCALDFDGVDPDLAPLLADCMTADPRARPHPEEIATRFATFAAGGTTGTSRPCPASPGYPVDPAVIAHQPTSVHAQLPAPTPSPTAQLPAPERTGEAPRQLDDLPQPAPRRTGLLAAYSVAIIALGAAMPFVALVVVSASVWGARFLGKFVDGVRWRHSFDGPRRSNVVKEVLASPWRAVTSAVLAFGHLIAPGIVAGGISTVSLLYVQQQRLSGLPLNAGAAAITALALLVLRWGPGGRSLRLASRQSARAIAPGRTSAAICAAAFLIVAVAIITLVVSYPAINSWPLPQSWDVTTVL